MDQRRQVFWDNGYPIRKLNQAYFADWVAVVPEELAALVHVGFCFGDLAGCQQLINMNAGGMHFRPKVKTGWSGSG